LCCTQLAKNTGCKKSPKVRHLLAIAQLCRAISLQLGHVLTIGKNLLNSNISPTCSYNMVNFGPLVAEVGSLVWGTPANFNRFRILAALLHGTVVVGVSQTVALNRGCHLYLAGRPPRWALAHILGFLNHFLCVGVVYNFVTSPLRRVQVLRCMWLCLSVCLSTHILTYLKKHIKAS